MITRTPEIKFPVSVTESIQNQKFSIVVKMQGLLGNEASDASEKDKHDWALNFAVGFYDKANPSNEVSLNQWATDRTTLKTPGQDDVTAPPNHHPDNDPSHSPKIARHTHRKPANNVDYGGAGADWTDVPGRALPEAGDTKVVQIEYTWDFYDANNTYVHSATLIVQWTATGDGTGKVTRSDFKYKLLDSTTGKALNP